MTDARWLQMNIASLAGPERKYSPAYALAGMAMEFLGSHQEKYIDSIDSDETAYWLHLGHKDLRNTLIKK